MENLEDAVEVDIVEEDEHFLMNDKSSDDDRQGYGLGK